MWVSECDKTQISFDRCRECANNNTAADLINTERPRDANWNVVIMRKLHRR